MKSLLKLLPLKYKRKVNKVLRSVGLAAPTKRRVRVKKAAGLDTPPVTSA